MAYCVMEVENIDTEIIEDKDKIAAFEEKWKSIIDLFEGDFFTEEDGEDSYSQKGKVRLFTRQNTSINSRNFSTLDDGKPNKDRAFSRFFSRIIESEGDCAFGFGQEGFESEFYKDLLDLCCDEHASWCANADCGDGGYYSGAFTLGESGLDKSFTYYEQDDDVQTEDEDKQTEEIKNGLFESYHENGQLSKRENYKDGELDGPWEWFYENGKLMTRATFINGKKEGLLESFHSNGQLQMTENYKDNELDGLVEEFDEDGQLILRENYKDGVLQDEGDGQAEDTGTVTTDTAPKGKNSKDGKMNEQEKTVLGLGLYTCMADGEIQQAEVEFVQSVAVNYLGGANLTSDEFLNIIGGFLEAHEKAAEAGTVGSLVIEEAEKLDDEKWRLLALKFCLMVSQADDDEGSEEVEGQTMGIMIAAWERDGSWNYSIEEAVNLAVALDIDSVLQDEDDAQAEDTATVTTDAAPKGKNAPVAAELTEKVTVTLSKNYKTFKTESGNYRLERYIDNKIRAFKDDEVCKNTKNVLRAINKEYKLGFTSGDFKKMHTTKLGKEIIENMKNNS